ncbi:hypothetical protein GUITHDRAFT_165684, partial [Guillardia theta CCMP2712]
MRKVSLLLAATAVTCAVLVCVSVRRGEDNEQEKLDRQWVDAIPAFGTAMSTDDLSRQIHWLHKHNAAKGISPDAYFQDRGNNLQSSPPVQFETQDGEQIVPANRAAISNIQQSLKSAYTQQENSVRAQSSSTRNAMIRDLRSQVRWIAERTMEKLSSSGHRRVSPGMMKMLVKAIGAQRTSQLCQVFSCRRTRASRCFLPLAYLCMT